MASFPSMAQLFYTVGESLLSVGVKKLLTGAGLGLCTYSGMSTMLEKIISDANAQLMAGDGQALAILGLGGIDTCLSIILSACMVRVAIYSNQIQFFKQ